MLAHDFVHMYILILVVIAKDFQTFNLQFSLILSCRIEAMCGKIKATVQLKRHTVYYTYHKLTYVWLVVLCSSIIRFS